VKIYDISSKKTYNLGNGSHPEWSPNNEYLVYTITEDNTTDLVKSDIYTSKFDGTAQFRLTDTKNRIEIFPSWSNDGHKIVYSDYSTGNIYIL